MTFATNAPHETSQSRSGARVLLVDDEPDVLVALTGTLRRAGYCVRTTSNAERGLETLSQEVADVLITDIIMPSQNGVDLVKQVRALYPAIRVIAISGGGNFGPFD